MKLYGTIDWNSKNLTVLIDEQDHGDYQKRLPKWLPLQFVN